jgi:sortase (surface protein transpeptidase)
VRVLHWAAPVLLAALAWAVAPLPADPVAVPGVIPVSPVQSAVGLTPIASPPAVWDQPPAELGPAPVGRLQIPNLGIDAPVEPVLVDAQGSMAVPSRPDRVGWYSAGPRPGVAGDAVLDGHLDTAAGSAVFARLGSLHPGAAVLVVWGAGKLLHFTVSSLRLYDFDAHPDGLFATAGPPRISLITCAGRWDAQLGTYRQRLVVEAVPTQS